MNEQELEQKIDELTRKVDAVYISAEKTRKYFLWTLIGSAVVFILPLIGIMFAIPQILSMTASLSGLGSGMGVGL